MGLAVAIKQTTEPDMVPAPIGGVNTTDSVVNLPAMDCLAAFNFIARENGLQVRPGVKLRAKGFTSVSTEVRTLLTYEGNAEDGSADRFFSVTQAGIYDTTSQLPSYGFVGATDYEWPIMGGDAGFCTGVNFTTVGGKFLLVTDEANGYLYFNGTTWTAVTPAMLDGDAGYVTAGDTPAKFAYVMVWKNQVWFIPRDSANGYYLPVGTFLGTGVNGLKTYVFGNKFISGGHLNSLHNFTLDAGIGIDDHLVALSSSGDVVVYSGTDPATAGAFQLVGIWKVGALPRGRRGAASLGGDLYILCANGVISASELFRGADAGTLPAYITGKISSLVREDFRTAGTRRGWALVNHQAEGLLILTVPYGYQDKILHRQYVMNTTTRAWTRWVGLAMNCLATWKGKLYFGSRDTTFDDSGIYSDYGAVFTLEGDMDRSNLTPTGYGSIRSFLLTGYRPLNGGGHGRGQFIRPMLVASNAPSYSVEARYDFDIADPLVNINDPAELTTSSWGTALWGSGVWGAPKPSPQATTFGAMGIGRFSAIALTMETNAKTTLMGFIAMHDKGGLL